MKVTPRALNGIVALAITLCIVASLTGARAADEKTPALKFAVIDSSRLTGESVKALALKDFATKANSDAQVVLRFYVQNPLLTKDEQEEGSKLALAQSAPGGLSQADAAKLKQLTDKAATQQAHFDELKNTQAVNMNADKQAQLTAMVTAGQATQDRVTARKQQLQTEFEKEYSAREKQLLKEMKDSIAKVAKEKNITLVFNGDLCLYAENDITTDVLKNLDGK